MELKKGSMEKENNVQISPELAVFMGLHKLASVSELLRIDDFKLLQMEGFGWRLMKQVLKLRQI